MLALAGAYDFSLLIGSTTYGFTLDSDEDGGTKAWVEGLAPAVAPQVRDTAFGYSHTDPLIDLVAGFDDWHRGAGWFNIDLTADHNQSHGSHSYHYTQGVDLSWGQGVLSPQRQTGATTVVAPTKFLRSQPLGHFAACGRYLRQWSGSAWAERDDAGANVGYSDLIEYATSTGYYLLGALGGGGTSSEQYKYALPTVAFRGTNVQSNFYGASLVFNKPTGTVDDDILIMSINFLGFPHDLIPAAGWTLLAEHSNLSGRYMKTYWKRASSEPATYTVSFQAGGIRCVGFVSSFSGAVTSGSPFEAIAESTDSFVAPALPAINGINRLLVAIAAAWDPYSYYRTFTPPSGYTEITDTNTPHSLLTHAIATIGAGPAPKATFVESGNLYAPYALHLALIPATSFTWTQSTLVDASFAPAFFTVRGIATSDPVLWGITKYGQLRNSQNPSNAGAWSAADQIGSSTETVNGMRTLDDNIYIFKAEGIYKNTPATPLLTTGAGVSFLWPAAELRSVNNGKHHTTWRNKRIYVNYGNTIIELTPNNDAGDGLRVVFPVEGQPTSPELNGEITAIAPAFDALWFAVKNAAGNTYIWKGNPDTGEFHTVAYLGANDCSAMLITEAGTTGDTEQFHANNPALLFGYGTNGHYFINTRPGYTPWDDANYLFDTAQGAAFSSFFDFGAQAFTKFLTRGEIVTEDTDADDTVTLQYLVQGGSAVELVAAGGTAADVPISVSFNRIQYKLLFDNGANTTTPRLHGLAMHANVVIPRKRVWNPRILIANDLPLLSGGRSSQSASTLLTALETAVGSRMTLTDPFGRARVVRLLDFQSVGMKDYDYGGYQGQAIAYQLTLVGLETV